MLGLGADVLKEPKASISNPEGEAVEAFCNTSTPLSQNTVPEHSEKEPKASFSNPEGEDIEAFCTTSTPLSQNTVPGHLEQVQFVRSISIPDRDLAPLTLVFNGQQCFGLCGKTAGSWLWTIISIECQG